MIPDHSYHSIIYIQRYSKWLNTSSLKKIILLLMLYFIMHSKNLFTQTSDSKLTITFSAAYGNYGSIDDIHSPYRYQGNNITYFLDISKNSNFTLQSFKLRYGFYERKPSSVPIKPVFSIKSYDENYTYLWNTDETLLRKNTYVFQEAYNCLLPIYKGLNKNILIGPCQQFNVIYIHKPNSIELISLLAGISVAAQFKITSKLLFIINGNYSIGSINIRKSYAGIDGHTQQESSKYYLFDYIGRHAHFDFLMKQPNFQFESLIKYVVSGNFSVISNYKYYYQNIKYPQPLRIVDQNLGVGLSFKF